MFWVVVRGLDGSKAEMLCAIVWSTPGCELGKTMIVTFFRIVMWFDLGVAGSKTKEVEEGYERALSIAVI